MRERLHMFSLYQRKFKIHNLYLSNRLLPAGRLLFPTIMILLVTSGACAQSSAEYQCIQRTFRTLTLGEKIGQLLQIGIYNEYASASDPDYVSLLNQMSRYHIGSADLTSRMIGPNLLKKPPLQVSELLNRLQRESKIPLLVGGDFERGLASRLSGAPEFPFPMAFGAIGSPDLVQEFAAVTAEQARVIGIHWIYAPIADVNSNPLNPVINTRSFGEDSQQVSAFVAAYIRGAHHSHILVTAKHFPGTGDLSTDPHVANVTIAATRDHLDMYELSPFRAAIAAGTDAIMLAHAAVPALDPGSQRIATTSPKIVNDLLRRELGFQGVVITDALEMAGLTRMYPGEANPVGRAAVDAIKAGADVLMVLGDVRVPFEALLSAVESGDIPKTRIDESVRRILALKCSVGLDKHRFVDLDLVSKTFANPEPSKLAQRVSDASITLVRNNQHVLPFASTSRRSNELPGERRSRESLVVVAFSDSERSPLGHTFESQLRSRCPDAKIFHVYNDGINSGDADQILGAVKNADKIIIPAFITHASGRRVLQDGRATVPVGLLGASASLLAEIVARKPSETLVIALGSPYLIENYPGIENYVCTFSLTPTAEVSAVKAIFGEIQNQARLPITLPGVAPRGFSLPWPVVRNR
jgi:beta-N-acetylhexosaminidase